ncbi:MAG: hypothetical protein QOJ91_1269 [Sphingomonadales bacterium]|nr:hypothetical protein [Sphingomonadales bacterium]
MRFTAERREIYIAHLIATGDKGAAAAEVGVSTSTVDLHIRNDPVFAQVHREALDDCYVRLEQEVRLNLAAQARLRTAREAAGNSPPLALLEEEGAEFDRIMKLLARFDRKPHRPQSRFKPGGRRQAWTFEAAIVRLDKALDALARKTGKPRQPFVEG